MSRKRPIDSSRGAEPASVLKRRRVNARVLPYDTRPTFAVELPAARPSALPTEHTSATFTFVVDLPAGCGPAPTLLSDAVDASLNAVPSSAPFNDDALDAPDVRVDAPMDDVSLPSGPIPVDKSAPILSIQVSRSPQSLRFHELPLELLSLELLAIVLHAHHVKRAGPRTQERYLQIALRHECNRLCAHVRFIIATERCAVQTVDSDKLLALCERLMSLGDDVDSFPPTSSIERRLTVIRGWLDIFSNAAFQLSICATCSTLAIGSHFATRTLDREHLRVLTNPSLPAFLFPAGYDRRLVEDAVLDSAGIVRCRPDCVALVCNTCWSSLRMLRLPPLSLANDNYFGWDNVPDDIQLLFMQATPMELSLIGRNRVRCTIFKFTAQDAFGDDEDESSASYAPQYYTKGNVISFTNGNVDLLDVLPPAPLDLQATISVIFVGKVLPPPEELDRLTPLLVRRHVVVPILTWLIGSHPDYLGVKYSAAHMDQLLPSATEGVPCGIQMQLVTQSGTEDASAPTVPVERIAVSDISQIPVASSGVISGSFDALSIQQQKLAAMMLWKRKGATSWAVGHGETPVQEWDNPSYFTRLFPKLFPFGIGAPNDKTRRVPIPFEEHIRHLLSLSSRRFATDHVFQYVAMNIAQRKRVRQGIKWQVGRSFWQSAHDFLANADVEAIKRLSQRAEKHRGYVAPEDEAEKRVVEFMRMLKTVPVNVPGTPAAKKKMRNEIRATIHHRGLPSLFVTLNPADMYHPLFLKLAGVSVDLDARAQTNYPTVRARAYLVAKNPTAGAQFFDAMMTAFVDVVLGMKSDGNGLFGKVTAYYATVEAQARGSLHGHVLVWIAGSLPPQLLRDRMESDEQFKSRLFDWLHDIISSHLPESDGVISPSQAVRVKRPRGAPHSSTMRCPHPDDVDFEEEWRRQSQRVTFESHYHTHNATCWKYLKKGEPRDPALCRMRMNGETRPATIVDRDSGSILLRRWHPDINQHNPTLSMLARCNNDVKFIGSGEAAKALTYYVTDYITKDNLPTDEAFCALTKLVERIKDPLNNDISSVVGQDGSYSPDEHGARFLTRACNALLACREVSAQEVALFFHKSGSSDHYCSETYITIIWGAIIRWVVQQDEARAGVIDDREVAESAMSDNSASGDLEVVEFNGTRRVPSTQLDDYRWRGEELADLGLYWYFGCTSTVSAKSEDLRHSTRLHTTSRATARVPFLSSHPAHLSKLTRMRERFAVPSIVGPTLPRADRPDQYESYCQSMLVLFKPWRQLTDLRRADQTWAEAFSEHSFDRHSLRIMRNFAALHECKDASDAYRQLRRSGIIVHDILSADIVDKALATVRREDDENLADWLNEHHPGLVGYVGGPDLDGEGEYVRGADDDEILVSKRSVDSALKAKSDVQNVLSYVKPLRRADVPEGHSDCAELQTEMAAEDVTRYRAQTAQLKKDLPLWTGEDTEDEEPENEDELVRVHQWFHDPLRVRLIRPPDNGAAPVDVPGVILSLVQKYQFNAEQERAFALVASHKMSQSLEQLLMFVVGGGGTGKSHIVRGWDEFFASIGAACEIKKAAPTGIASYVIRAETLHALLKLHLQHVSAATLELLQSTWRCVAYLVIDEVSMVGARMLANISRRLQLILGNERPYGGVNIIFIGDPRQLSPVGDRAPWSEPSDKDPSSATAKGQLLAYGRSLWRKLTHVVVLKHNYRQARDAAYQGIVSRVGEGTANDSDCSVLRRRQIGVTPLTEDFVDAPLITASKLIRDTWNEHAVRRFAERTGQDYVEYVAVDRAQGRLILGPNRERLLAKSTSETKDRLGRLPLVVGMRVMVLSNLVTKGGIVNGAEGTVRRIIYSVTPTGERYLVCVLVHVEGSILQYPDLDVGVVPVFPDSKFFEVRRRDQSTMTGRTLQYAILDLASCKSHESVYVMLSRVVSLKNVLILRRFMNRHVTSDLLPEARRALQDLVTANVNTSEAWSHSPLDNYLRQFLLVDGGPRSLCSNDEFALGQSQHDVLSQSPPWTSGSMLIPEHGYLKSRAVWEGATALPNR